ncbi:hypothetical protein HanRHA438_Chr00c07g0846881 [Helianthus annuus]|nr:hypothetical protein HanPI659440_Chr08g0314661 [Helianthus annuus]KAJ0954849.1 hypothetical protein HanRHA438_Chr00c07g0846881 [Helianthus annuus]
MVGRGLRAWCDTWSGGAKSHANGASKTKSQFQRGMVGRGWGSVAWLVLLANEVSPCHVGSPAQRLGLIPRQWGHTQTQAHPGW